MISRQCAQCSKTFHSEDTVLAFYQKITVPPPTLCPDCRQQRRLAWCNEGVLYKSTCARCQKPIISQFHPANPRPVWCVQCWWKDDWTALDYGQTIDWSRPFFEQWHALELQVPHACVAIDEVSENSDYTHHAGQNKNCYLIFHATYNENSLYSYGIKKSKDCVDVHNCFASELCYESIDIHNCYNLGWSQDCYDCHNSRFLRDCRGVADSFLCVGLRNKKYCWLNEQLSAAEYQRKMNDINLGSHQQFEKYWQQFIILQQRHSYPYAQLRNVEDVSGNYLTNAKSAHHSYDCTDVEHVSYCYQLQLHGKDMMDVYQFGIDTELVYEGAMVGNKVYNVKFSYLCIFGVSDLSYCMECYNRTNNCFGCFGLKGEKFCILNKQYSGKEFQTLTQKLITHMQATKEWGEFFPMQYSQSAYNETMAQLWYPLNKSEVQSRQWRWQDDATIQTSGLMQASRLPDNIQDVSSNITTQTIACQQCAKPYRITAQELLFYQQRHYPLPRACFACRRLRRMQQRNPRTLWQRQCMCIKPDHSHQGRCAVDFATTYAPDRKELVYCENCYQRELY